MKQTILQTQQDLRWLLDVHLKHVPQSLLWVKNAILHGNEDYPQKVELFKTDDYRETPLVFVADEDGKLQEVK